MNGMTEIEKIECKLFLNQSLVSTLSTKSIDKTVVFNPSPMPTYLSIFRFSWVTTHPQLWSVSNVSSFENGKSKSNGTY